MKKLALSMFAAMLLSATGTAGAWWGNGWGGWNPYDPWDPRYWIEEFFGGGYYGGGPWGYGGPWGNRGPWGYGYPYRGGWGSPYYGGWGSPYYGGWGYAPYAPVLPVTATRPKAPESVKE